MSQPQLQTKQVKSNGYFYGLVANNGNALFAINETANYGGITL